MGAGGTPSARPFACNENTPCSLPPSRAPHPADSGLRQGRRWDFRAPTPLCNSVKRAILPVDDSRRAAVRRAEKDQMMAKRRGWFHRRRTESRGDRFERFTTEARRAFTLAQEEARRFNHNYIGTEHLLLGLVREGDGIAARVLTNLGVELPKVRSAVAFIIGQGDGTVTSDPGLTPRTKQVIELAMDEARRLKSKEIGTEHLLLGLVREGEGIAAGVLESFGVGMDQVRTQTMAAIMRPDKPLPPLPPPSPRRQGMAINQPHGTVGAVRAQELVYGLPLPPETLTKLAAVAQRLNRPLDDLMREAIARTWLADAAPPTDADPSPPGSTS